MVNLRQKLHGNACDWFLFYAVTRQSDERGRCTSPWAALGSGKPCQSTTRRRTATTKRYTRRGVDAVVLTAAWAEPWAGEAAAAAGEGTGNESAAAHGRGASPHAQTGAHTTCPHVPLKSRSSNLAKMKVRLTKSGIEEAAGRKVRTVLKITCHFIYPTITRQADLLGENKSPRSALVSCQSKQNLPAAAKSKLTQVNLSQRAINLP